MSYGPLVQKTFSENWQQALMGWRQLQYYASPLPSYSEAEQALFYDEYPSIGTWIISNLLLHKGYPMSMSGSLKCNASNTKYYDGIVLWPAEQLYSALVQAKNMANSTSPPDIRIAQNEYSTGSNVVVVAGASESTYHDLKMDYNPSTLQVTPTVDGVAYAARTQDFKGHAHLGVITATDNTGYHTDMWLKNVSATGVMVVGIASQGCEFALYNSTNVVTSPRLHSNAPSYYRQGLELARVGGFYNNVVGANQQYASTSGNCKIIPFCPPNLASWNTLECELDINGGTAKIQITDEFDQLLPDNIIPGNSSKINLTSLPISLTNVDAATYPRLGFRLWLTGADVWSSPKIYSLFATFSTTTTSLSFTKVAPQLRDVSPISFNGTSVDIACRIIDYAEPTSELTTEIYDSGHTLVRTLTSTKSLGFKCGFDMNQTVTWDGKNESGVLVSNGTYYPKFTVTDSLGNQGFVDSYSLTTTTPAPTTTTPAPTINNPLSIKAASEILTFANRVNGALKIKTSSGTIIAIKLGDTGPLRIKTSVGIRCLQ